MGHHTPPRDSVWRKPGASHRWSASPGGREGEGGEQREREKPREERREKEGEEREERREKEGAEREGEAKSREKREGEAENTKHTTTQHRAEGPANTRPQTASARTQTAKGNGLGRMTYRKPQRGRSQEKKEGRRSASSLPARGKGEKGRRDKGEKEGKGGEEEKQEGEERGEGGAPQGGSRKTPNPTKNTKSCTSSEALVRTCKGLKGAPN